MLIFLRARLSLARHQVRGRPQGSAPDGLRASSGLPLRRWRSCSWRPPALNAPVWQLHESSGPVRHSACGCRRADRDISFYPAGAMAESLVLLGGFHPHGYAFRSRRNVSEPAHIEHRSGIQPDRVQLIIEPPDPENHARGGPDIRAGCNRLPDMGVQAFWDECGEGRSAGNESGLEIAEKSKERGRRKSRCDEDFKSKGGVKKSAPPLGLAYPSYSSIVKFSLLLKSGFESQRFKPQKDVPPSFFL